MDSPTANPNHKRARASSCECPLAASPSAAPALVLEQEPLPLPGLTLPTASYQRIWARPADDLVSPHFIEALLAPGNKRAYIKVRDINPAGANPKPLYLCSELELDADGVFVPTERGTVVVKAARLQAGEELEAVTAGRAVAPRRKGADEPAEEAKAMALLTKALGKDESTGVMPLLDCFVDGDRWLYMVQPFYNRGDLVEVLSGLARQGQLGTPSFVRWARSVFGQLVGSLQVLKKHGIAHLDLSPENVLYGEGPVLGDFGMALHAPVPTPMCGPAPRSDKRTVAEESQEPEGEEEDDHPPHTPAKAAPTGAGDVEGGRKKREREEGDRGGSKSIGTSAGGRRHKPPAVLLTAQKFRGKIAYSAPEMLLEQPFDPFAADVFSLGCTLFALLAGRLLLEPSSKSKDGSGQRGAGGGGVLTGRPRFAALLRRDFGTLFDSTFQLPPDAVELITGMIDPDPRQRLTIEKVAAHPWVQGL